MILSELYWVWLLGIVLMLVLMGGMGSSGEIGQCCWIYRALANIGHYAS